MFKCGIIKHVAGECGARHVGNGVGKGGGGCVNGGDCRGEGRVGLGVEPANPPGRMGESITVGGKGKAAAVQQGIPPVNGVGGMVEEGLGGKSAVEECREDYGYGDWTVVQRRKPKGFLNVNNGRGGSQVRGVVKKPSMGATNAGKPLFFYSRKGKRGVNGRDQWRRRDGGSTVVADGGCSRGAVEHGIGGRRPIRWVEKGVKGGYVSGLRGEGGCMGGEKGQDECSSLIDEGAKKRRRGATEAISGGDASPIVDQ